MVAPDMATMLGFITTDAALPSRVLQAMLTRATQKTFNSITVDSDTSTSDMVLLFATGTAGNEAPKDAGDPELDDFKRALHKVMHDLALQVVKDGEGATKLMEITVNGAEDEEAARRIGFAIGNSPLVKTMVAAADPNWGRLVMAVGKAGCWADRDKLNIRIGDVLVAEEGSIHPGYVEAEAAEHMQGEHVHFTVDVGVGDASATVWSCDLTERYVEINASYRS
jgi:glutamate N-acetyltransferase/amino-acid N-acetyltransferase